MIAPMLTLALLLAAADPVASIDGLPIGALAPQPAPAKGCTAYLFTTGRTKALAATLVADTGVLRVAIDGKPADLARATASAPGMLGFPADSEFRGTDVAIALTMTVAERAGLTQGAMVPEAVLRIDRTGGDSVAIPLAGMVGCSG